MDDILVESTELLLLPGEQTSSYHPLSLLLKLFLVFVFFFAFVFALFIGARLYRRKLIRKEELRQRQGLAFRRKRGIPDSDQRPLNIALWHARYPHGPEKAATSGAEPYRQDGPNFVKDTIRKRQFNAEPYMVQGNAELKTTNLTSFVHDYDRRYTSRDPPIYPRPSNRTSEEEIRNCGPWFPNPVAAKEVQVKPEPVNPPRRFRVPSPSPSVELDTSDSLLVDTLASHSSADNAGPQAQNEPTHKVSSADEVIQAASGESPMAVDEDENGNHDSSQRGKKRDRAEVDSTSSEDEDDDDASELDAGESVPPRSVRKRQTFSRHESDIDVVASRNQKHDRHSNGNEADSDSEDEMWHPLRKKSSKRKKPSVHLIKNKLSEHGDRAIGEEWIESNIKWKLGPDRELLRQDLVKQVDPVESKHIDRLSRPEIYVEKWFTMEEHVRAHGSRILIGQETPRERFVKAQKRAVELNRELDKQNVFPSQQLSLKPESTQWATGMKNQELGLDIGFNEALYKELLSLPPMPAATSADQERPAKRHAVVDKVTSQPAKMPKSMSSSIVSSAEINKSLHPLTSSTSMFSPSLPATAHPTLQSAIPSGSGLSNASSHFAAREAGTPQPTNSFNFPSTSIMSGTNAATPQSHTTFQSQFSLGSPACASNTATVIAGPSRPSFSEMSTGASATESSAVTNPFITKFSQSTPSFPSGAANQFNFTGFSNASSTTNSSPVPVSIEHSGFKVHSQPSTIASNPFSSQRRELGVNNVSNTPAMGSNTSMFGSDGNVNMPQPSTSAIGTIGGTSNPFNDAGTSNVFGGTTLGANMQADSVPSSQMSRSLFKFGETGGQSSNKDNLNCEAPAPVLNVDVGSSDVYTVNPTSSSLFNALGSQQTSTPESASSSNMPSSASGTDIGSAPEVNATASDAEFDTFATGGPASAVPSTVRRRRPKFKFPLPNSSSTVASSGGGSNDTGASGASSSNTVSQFTFRFSVDKGLGF